MITVAAPMKLFVSDLKECEIKEKGTCSLTILSQRLQQKVNVHFEDVWLQGLIDDPKRDVFLLDDRTGKAIIQPLSSINDNKSWISKGIPCLVLGTLVQKSPITVKPFKIANLQNNPNHKHSWPSEVEESKSVLSNQITGI